MARGEIGIGFRTPERLEKRGMREDRGSQVGRRAREEVGKDARLVEHMH